jgi:hypothetical protein
LYASDNHQENYVLSPMTQLRARKGLGWLVPAVALGLALGGSTAAASDASLVSADVRGMVVRLVGDHWEEVGSGQDLAGATLKTMRSGRLTIESGGALTIEVEPNATIAFRESTGGTTVLFQYRGALTLSDDKGAGPRVALRAGNLTLTGLTGEVEVRVDRGSVELSVKGGTAMVMAGGTPALVKAGTYLVADNGSLSLAPGVGAIEKSTTAATPTGTVGTHGGGNGNAKGANDTASGSSNGSSNSGNNNAGGNGGGNAGSGNNNAGGNGGGNAGSGNNNAGGNGGGNAGSGDNNAGGNSGDNAGAGNNNAGGNGGGNAGGGNSNAGGNGGGNSEGSGKNNAGGNGPNNGNGNNADGDASSSS